ncbi:MAG: hypothetical protein E7Z90_02560 [Cyanobacteria bacterium SIG29]|nr:hypothetical protein [Cyanobacteria bacterium SIG29]
MFKNKKGFTTGEIVLSCVVIVVIATIFLLFFVGTDNKDPISKIKKMGYTLRETVLYAEGATNQKSLDWDYSLSPNDFFRKYLHEYLNYSYMQERNLKDDLAEKAYFVRFVDDSFIELKKGECMEYHYDANGANKPNQFGQDQYTFYLCPRAYADKNNFINNPNMSK